MARIDPNATSDGPVPASRRRRWAWIAIATVGLASASALLAVPALANDDGAAHDRVVVCESGVVTNGDVQTSSAVAVRLPAGDTTPVPDGCHEG